MMYRRNFQKLGIMEKLKRREEGREGRKSGMDNSLGLKHAEEESRQVGLIPVPVLWFLFCRLYV